MDRPALSREEAFYSLYYWAQKAHRLGELALATAAWHFVGPEEDDDTLEEDDASNPESVQRYFESQCPHYLVSDSLTNFRRHGSVAATVLKLLDLFEKSLKHRLLVRVLHDTLQEAHKATDRLRLIVRTCNGRYEGKKLPSGAKLKRLKHALWEFSVWVDVLTWDVHTMAEGILGTEGAFWFLTASSCSRFRDDFEYRMNVTMLRRRDPDQDAALLLRGQQSDKEAGQSAADETRDKWCYEQAMQGRTYPAIAGDLRKQRDYWGRLGEAGVKQAAFRHARKHGKPFPPPRRPGRRPNY